MTRKLLLLSGVLAAALYTLAVILGGILWPGYSHLSQPVSELIAAFAPTKTLLDPIFAIYNLLVAAFGVGLLMIIRQDTGAGKRWGWWAGALLIAEGAFGFATLFFPQDPIGAAATLAGTLHIVLAGLSSLATMLIFVFFALWLLKTRPDSNLRVFSFIILAVVFVSGGLAAYTVPTQHPLAGLAERGAIFGFIIWLAVASFQLYKQEPA